MKPERVAHRAVLDHILGLVAGSDCVDSLILRGSMTLPAWLGDRAREPNDLDWVVRPVAAVPVDDLSPYPYLNHPDPVRTWPEIAHGAGRNDIWEYEDFDTGGLRAHLPPEGLYWVPGEDTTGLESPPHHEVVDLIRNNPQVPGGPLIDVDAMSEGDWSYVEYGGAGGTRTVVPWRLDESTSGSVQVDFAYDETLPEAPQLVAVPRGDGGTPAAVWAATRELSLLWKLQWLHTDQEQYGISGGKDLYDCVLLAELGDVRLSRRLLRLVPPIDPDAVRRWVVDWSSVPSPGDGAQWLERLIEALQPVLRYPEPGTRPG